MRQTMKTLNVLGMVVMISLAFGSSVASAAVKGHTWEFNGTLLGAGQSETCRATSDGTITLKSEIVREEKEKVIKEEFHLTSTGIETTGCRLSQSHSGSEASAEGTFEKISFSGLAVDKPVGCSVNSPITTGAVKSKVITVGEVAYTTFSPESGTTFANITLTGCSAAGTYPLKGSVCAEMQQAGSLKFEQRLLFSEAADKACATDTLTLASTAAILRNSFVLDPTGPGEGKQWGFTATADQPHTWEVNGAKLAAGASETCKATSDGTLTLKASIFGAEFHLTSTAVATEGCKIIQNGSGSAAIAEGTIGKLTLSGISIDTPVGCKIGSIVTVPLKSKIFTTVSPAVPYTTFSPESGTTWANVSITECALAETYPLKGSICAEMSQVNVFQVEQTIKFSEAADKACPTDTLTFGSTAILRGGVVVEMTSGTKWGFTSS